MVRFFLKVEQNQKKLFLKQAKEKKLSLPEKIIFFSSIEIEITLLPIYKLLIIISYRIFFFQKATIVMCNRFS